MCYWEGSKHRCSSHIQKGDLLFLLDSSGSVSYYEFSRIKEFIAELLLPFTFGPHDVQTGIVHISTMPILEFPFDRHFSTGAIQHAIRNIQQVMGDTNTGQTISFAKEKLFRAEAGARPNVPKVLVWVTDGFSKGDVTQPMQLLKDMGVTVFIVSTGRGNYLELSAAASQPPEKHLHFVDVDDLGLITKELQDSIAAIIQAKRLRATDITASSFRLTWPQLLTRDTGYYILEHAPSGEPQRKVTKQLTGDHTSLVVAQLASQTDYEVVLIPESNEKYIPPQTTRVTTLEGKRREGGIFPRGISIHYYSLPGLWVLWRIAALLSPLVLLLTRLARPSSCHSSSYVLASSPLMFSEKQLPNTEACFFLKYVVVLRLEI
uniref:von Willebrand factor A domain-containing protein 1 n=1 Tax=Laticauda laticaudata TaxID=8630 RepID=A0A8C5SNV4_LATLA